MVTAVWQGSKAVQEDNVPSAAALQVDDTYTGTESQGNDPRRLLPPSSSSSSGSSSGSSPRRNLIVDPRTPKCCSRA
uniref:Uncharacterized protein n=1 Tax=Knipowitschia caucasica TaxID=637954 RepID=A0AAV2KRR4_KNICA